MCAETLNGFGFVTRQIAARDWSDTDSGADTARGRGDTGCKTVFDIAPADLSPLSGDELRAHLL